MSLVMTHDMSVTRFRLGMSRVAGAVSIVATGLVADPASWRGMTATAVCSLCAEPPSLVACLNRISSTYQQLDPDGMFSVNVLSSRHINLARIFAGQTGLAGADRFTPTDWTKGISPVPVLADALVSFECRVAQSVEYGTHSLLIGDIIAAWWAENDLEPLVYHRHRFRDLGHDIEATGGPIA
jgi:flavin reductase (DIM6/NTAB) family NADH-FMN oxidoreductase RutF